METYGLYDSVLLANTTGAKTHFEKLSLAKLLMKGWPNKLENRRIY